MTENAQRNREAEVNLLAAARDRGLTAIGGMELLVQQAILAFSRFTGTDLDREAVRRDLLAMVGEK